MVVCKCRKATNLYCFVHKIPVCGECICSSDHQICVVRTYSEWVIDGDYDWPPKCSLCSEVLQHGEIAVSRLGCLHVFHLSCFSKHLGSFPPHTAPAGYTCPVCSTPVWPPKYVKDHNVALSMNLKEIILQNGLSKNLLGNEAVVSQPPAPPAFASAPLTNLSTLNHTGNQTENLTKGNSEQFSATKPQSAAYRIGDGVSASNANVTQEGNEAVHDTSKAHTSLNMAALSKLASPTAINPGAMTRKNSARVEKIGLDYTEYDGEDEDEASKKYAKRGPLQKQALKYLLPFSPNALPTLPTTMPSRKDDHNVYAEDIIEGRQRRRARSSGLNTKKILLLVAIMSCMVTMLLLYYRLLQGTPSEDHPESFCLIYQVIYSFIGSSR
ncbi:hypothetical protein GOP47_0012675 [Adiantum capillus-veneris]|uniref:RING-type domain-containing protein n=1 Tax=Adiantum capillus-veneris TaxID=13818 RepID=A0A9D4URK4_ADICA|nr:hypothetical protein GOP47_0012675 [Adiantum capillus-veneris]